MQARQPRYEWRLRELMAVRKDRYTTTKLTPELRKILECRFEDLVVEIEPQPAAEEPTRRGPAPGRAGHLPA